MVYGNVVCDGVFEGFFFGYFRKIVRGSWLIMELGGELGVLSFFFR